MSKHFKYWFWSTVVIFLCNFGVFFLLTNGQAFCNKKVSDFTITICTFLSIIESIIAIAAVKMAIYQKLI